MVNIHKCPYCHNHSERPIVGGYVRQQVFDYIWDHPNCTVREILAALFGRSANTSVVAVHITKAKNALVGSGYSIESFRDPSGYRNRSVTYSILKPGAGNKQATSEANQRGSTNGTV